MPWEIDHALLIADKLKDSINYIDNTHTIYIDTVLNLSSYIIDWNQSQLPKEFFIEKYNLFNDILGSRFIHKSKIYDGSELYGHLDLQKQLSQSNIDYYWLICPDITFSTTLLYYLIESSKQLNDEYFVLTPQIYKCWDATWDLLVNKNFKDIPYSQYLQKNSHEIKYIVENSNENIQLNKLNTFKFAGWCDFYNKNFIERLVPPLENWVGYGPWDLYSMNVCNIAKHNHVNVSQYTMENQIMWFYDSGDLGNIHGEDGALKTVYKKFLKIKGHRHDQRTLIENNLNLLLNDWIKYAMKEKIIKTY